MGCGGSEVALDVLLGCVGAVVVGCGVAVSAVVGGGATVTFDGAAVVGASVGGALVDVGGGCGASVAVDWGVVGGAVGTVAGPVVTRSLGRHEPVATSTRHAPAVTAASSHVSTVAQEQLKHRPIAARQ